MNSVGWLFWFEVSSGLVGFSAALAQLVEHRIRNAGVTGSSPVGGTTKRLMLLIIQYGLAGLVEVDRPPRPLKPLLIFPVP